MNDKQSEYIEQLFDTLRNDPTIPAELKISLLRLQLPVHKISQSDPAFISNDKHPARSTIFIIKRLSHHAISDPSLITKIDLLLSELVKSNLSINNFSAINQRLELLTQNIEPDKHENNISNKQNDNDLKVLLNNKLKLCIQDRKIPAPCKTLILKLWPNSLFYLLKTHGEHSPQWSNAIDMYLELLESIQPLQTIEQFRHLKDTFLSVARTNNNMLMLYHQESKIQPEIKTLISYYNELLGKNNEIQNLEKMSALDKISCLPSNIKPGIWCEIYIDDITPARRLRLSLINLNNGKLIFVNRKGIKKIEKDAQDFSQELKRGLSRVYSHDALFTKATHAAKTRYKKIS